MNITSILRRKAIKLDIAARTKDEVIEEMVTLLANAHRLPDPALVFADVKAREALMSTAIGGGIAVPHAKTKAVSELIAGCGLCRQGADFDADDGEPVRLVFLLLSPVDPSGLHVQALADIAKLVTQDDVRSELLESPSPRRFYKTLKNAERKYL
jgi:mannitol/fructose-specific phosphotransferase system IIA component (Ntr-type)